MKPAPPQRWHAGGAMSQIRSAGLGLDRGGPSIDGLLYIKEFLTKPQEAGLISDVYASEWDDRTINRRIQQYGAATYDYTGRGVGQRAEPFPEWAEALARFVERAGAIPYGSLDQCIINEYLPGQGIGLHSDHPGFGPHVATVSIMSDVDMTFDLPGKRKETVRLEARSLVVLSGAARNVWRHGIDMRESDMVGGVKVPRSDRVSITFRSVL